MDSNGWFKYKGFRIKAFQDPGVPLAWLAEKDVLENRIASYNLPWLMNSIDSIIGFYWAFRPGQQPTTYDGKIPVPETEKTETSNPHPLEPKPAKICTCGAHTCGHSGHSSWCDSLE